MLMRLFGTASLISIALASPANAALPAPVKAMLDAAIASNNEADVKTIVKLAKQTNPDDAAEIDTMLAGFNAQQAAKAAAKAEADKQALRMAGFFENWSGQGELGAFRSTGNTRNTGLAAGIKLNKEAEKWRLGFRALADYQRTNGVTTKEQFLAALEPHYKFNERLFAYGLAQYERDTFQGFSSRTSLSGGLGYRVIDGANTTLDVKAGPAWRKTQLTTGGSTSNIAGLGALDFAWKISPSLKLTETATAYIQSGNNSFASTTALDTKLIGALSARFSYTVEHETSPPAGRQKTDTLSRVTIVYDF